MPLFYYGTAAYASDAATAAYLGQMVYYGPRGELLIPLSPQHHTGRAIHGHQHQQYQHRPPRYHTIICKYNNMYPRVSQEPVPVSRESVPVSHSVNLSEILQGWWTVQTWAQLSDFFLKCDVQRLTQSDPCRHRWYNYCFMTVAVQADVNVNMRFELISTKVMFIATQLKLKQTHTFNFAGHKINICNLKSFLICCDFLNQ